MPATAPLPLPEGKTALVARLVEGLDASALHWLSGYMAGAAALFHGATQPAANTGSTDALPTRQLTIVYGSQTGNAKRLAEQLAERADEAGLAVTLLRADAYPTRQLKHERLLYVVISTHSNQDDVEPPDDSRALFEFITGPRAPQLPELEFAVLGLGDSSYPDFCGIGKRLDRRLLELGARRIHDRGDADVDVQTVANPWLQAALARARDALTATVPTTISPAAASVTALRPRAPAWTRDKPFAARVLANQRITGRGSEKDVRHLELSLEGSGLQYEPGDALGLWPTQAPALVQAILATLELDAETPVQHEDETLPLRRWLGERRELTRLTRPFLAAHAKRGKHASLNALLGPSAREGLAQLFESMQLVDLLRSHRSDWDAQELVAALRPLAPRLYSVASSPRAVDEEVHLTVAHIDYRLRGESRWGTASHFLADAALDTTVPVFIESNERFRLPADPDRDVIMIGPGTGVAPFRAFVQERQLRGGRGRQWLFFGNPHQRTDFLYQTEWQAALKDGSLQRLDVAFSRDQASKVYVQQRLREQGRALYAWLQEGAHLYVCGDAARMAGDVHTALLEIAGKHGNKDREAAEAWLAELAQSGRYARDVY